MCGIIGYIGAKNTTNLLIRGLQRLEYRGYDSAGIAVHTEDGFYRQDIPGILLPRDREFLFNWVSRQKANSDI